MSDATVGSAIRRFELGEVFGWDLYVAVLFAAGALWVATGLNQPDKLIAAAPALLAVLGVIVGSVIAALTILAAFMQPSLLRNLDAIGKGPERYLAPFVFTALIGIVGLLAGLVFSVLGVDDPNWLTATAATVSVFFCVWSLASLVRCLSMVLQFAELLKQSALIEGQQDVPRIDQRRTS